MNESQKEIYLKVGGVVSFGFVLLMLAIGALAAMMHFFPTALTADTIEQFQIFVGLFFLVAWFAIIGSYSIAYGKSRLATWMFFGLFPPFALYTMLMLMIRSTSPLRPKLSVIAIGKYALRAAIGLD